MDDHNMSQGSQREPTSNVPQKLDPLRRVFVPIEKRRSDGTIIFRTHDNLTYTRREDGSIRRAIPKENGKAARKRRRMNK